MVHRGTSSLSLSLFVAGASMASMASITSIASAQNVLPNPEFDTTIVPWSSEGTTATWDSVDSRACPGSGALEVPCLFSDELLNDVCLPYSAATAHLAYNLRASSDVPGSEQFGFLVETFSDTECQTSILGFPVLVGQIGDVPATYQTFEHTQVLAVGTQSIKVSFLLSDNNCEAKMVFFLDALYYGEGDRIFSHDFENGDPCPFAVNP